MPLREFSLPEVEEMEWRMKDVEWTEEGAPSRSLTGEEQEYIFHSLQLSRLSFDYWIRRYCKILTDQKRMEALIPWPSQVKILEKFAIIEKRQLEREGEAKMKAILLKSRQIGGTVIGEALVGHMCFLNPRTQGIIASDHPDNSLKLWQVFTRIYDHLPGWMRPHREAKVKATNLHFDRMMSDVVVGSGNQKTTLGQGMNVDAVHLTEVSTWEHPGYIDEDLLPAFDSSHKDHSLCILESTGSGAKGNWFHDEFRSAQQGTSLFDPIFIAWYDRPGWRMSAEGIIMGEETLAMAERVKREMGLTLDKEQLSFWQQRKVAAGAKDQLEIFYQEFPSTIEEAFQTGLRSAFSITVRSRVRDECRVPLGVYDVNFMNKKLREVASGPEAVREWLKDPSSSKSDNRLIIWEDAIPGHVYLLGVDVSYGLEGGDSSAVEVLRIGNRDREDEQVAEWRGNISPLDVATVVEILGKMYADPIDKLEAMVAVEVNPGSPGIVTQTELMRRGYPHFYTWSRPDRLGVQKTKTIGWWTTPSTKPLITEGGVEGIKKGHLLINSPFFVEEMGTFVNVDGVQRDGTYRPSGRRNYSHAPGYHDDRIIALFIAFHIAHAQDTRSVAEDRRRVAELSAIPKSPSREFISLGLSWEEAMEQWERDVLDLL